MMALNWDERSIQVFTSSIDRSKFFTYSPYIFIKGASFCRMSPIRGFCSLREREDKKRKEDTVKVKDGNIPEFHPTVSGSEF